MNEATLVILVHQALFQGCFFIKNRVLSRKLGMPVRGDNPEARRAILFFAGFILVALALAAGEIQWGGIRLLPDQTAVGLSLLLLAFNMVFGLASLHDLGESWRVGVIEEQSTELVECGIYRFTRNPLYIVLSLVQVSVAIWLDMLWILLLLPLSIIVITRYAIAREERYLEKCFGQDYRDYKARVRRWL